MKKTSFIFAHPTAEQISNFNDQTSDLVSQKLVNFPENGKCVKTKNPARKTTAKQLSALQSANQQRALSAQVEHFKNAVLQTIEQRAVIAHQKPSSKFRTEVKYAVHQFTDDPALMYQGVKSVAQFDVTPEGVIDQIKISDSRDQYYLQQKEIQKLPLLLKALARGDSLRGTERTEIANAHYMRLFAIALCEGFLTLSQFRVVYTGLNRRYHIDADFREFLLKIDAGAFTTGTGQSQSGQSKKLFRLMGLIDYKKSSFDTPVVITEGALSIIKQLAGRAD